MGWRVQALSDGYAQWLTVEKVGPRAEGCLDSDRASAHVFADEGAARVEADFLHDMFGFQSSVVSEGDPTDDNPEAEVDSAAGSSQDSQIEEADMADGGRQVIRVSKEHYAFFAEFQKRRGMKTLGEAVDAILKTAISRRKALDNYDASTKGKPRKAAKKRRAKKSAG